MPPRSQGQPTAAPPLSDDASDAVTTISTLLGPLFAHSPDAILVTDQAGTYVDANPAACALLGFTHTELARLTIEDVVDHPQGWAAQEYARLLREGQWE